ncbi:MAG: hypothetical protein RJQ08_16055 [Salinisphaeraceae bacterium]
MPPGFTALVVALILATAGLGALSALLWLRLRRVQARLDPSERSAAIEVTIDNPIELAREHTRWGGQLGRLAPRLVSRRVYDQVAAEVRDKLVERGVVAEVRVRRA